MQDKILKKLESLTDELNSIISQKEDLDAKSKQLENRAIQLVGAISEMKELLDEVTTESTDPKDPS